jgi:hypothetical protein
MPPAAATACKELAPPPKRFDFGMVSRDLRHVIYVATTRVGERPYRKAMFMNIASGISR